MTMAIDDGVNLEDPGDEDPEDEDEDDELEDSSDTETGNEVGGGGAEDPNEETAPVTPMSSWAQFQELLKDPEVAQTFQDTVADYQARMTVEAALKQDAEALQKMIDDEDWEGVGKAVVERTRRDAVQKEVREAVVGDMFRPVYTELLSQPEMQNLTAEDREALHIDKFNGNHAAHTTAISSFIAKKRYDAEVAEAVKKGVADALEAEKNKGSSEKAKAPSLAGRSPASLGVVQPKVTSADLIREGLRGIVGTQTADEDE